MPGPLTQAGAVSEPSEYAALAMDRHITGFWTQRSLLRDADVPYLYGKFYGASRYDSLCDGLNREISSRLTSIRRPGSSVWNANIFPALNSFYTFKYIQSQEEVVRIIADGQDGNIYEVTGGIKADIFTKSAGAGKSRFVGVNSTLYFGDGVDLKKWVCASLAWEASTTFAQGNFILDLNNNIQKSIGSQTATIIDIMISGNVVTLYFSPNANLNVPLGTKITIAGATAIPALNGQTITINSISNSQQVSGPFTHSDVPYTTETGSATTGTGESGATAPTWSSTYHAITVDGGVQWECMGSAIQNWGIAAPTIAPTVTQAAAPSIYQAWAANTWYAPLFVILDSNGNLQQLTTPGTTGSTTPTWATTTGATTTDGTAIWTCMGASAWAPSTVYAVGALVQATFSYWITVPQVTTTYIWTGYANVPVVSVTYVQQQVTATGLFKCTIAGTSGASTPGWTNGTGTTTTDNTVTWKNQGIAPAWLGATQSLSLAAGILDSNNNVEIPQTMGKTGATAPTWASSVGSFTTDGAMQWKNNGVYSPANAGAWIYSYSGMNSTTGDIGTASQESQPITVTANNLSVIQGQGLSDPQIDTLVLWRTAQGQSTLVQLDMIPNPGAGQSWVYTDTTPDTSLNAFIPAPVARSADPPQNGMTAPIYHLQRVWGIVNNTVVWSAGPDAVTGNGNTQFPPLNYIAYPEQPVRLIPFTTNNGGIMVLTTSNIYVILGTGTTSNPFYTTIYMPGVGILNYDAVDVIGSTLYLMTSKSKLVSIDPSAGYVEIGFPIGDQFTDVTTGIGSYDGFNTTVGGALYDPSTATVSWHEQGSGDTAIYVSDGRYGWFRYSPVATPESGYVWSPRATIIGGCSFAQSVEVSPGISKLLIAPYGGGPILQRDSTVNTDWVYNAVGSQKAFPYPSYQTIGNITLCESGEIAEIAHIGLKSVLVGSKPTVSILLGELAATAAVPFDVLHVTAPDPPDLPPSQTIYSDRYVTMQNGVCPLCEHFQLKIDYGMQAVADELLKYSIYGAHHSERKQQ